MTSLGNKSVRFCSEQDFVVIAKEEEEIEDTEAEEQEVDNHEEEEEDTIWWSPSELDEIKEEIEFFQDHAASLGGRIHLRGLNLEEFDFEGAVKAKERASHRRTMINDVLNLQMELLQKLQQQQKQEEERLAMAETLRDFAISRSQYCSMHAFKLAQEDRREAQQVYDEWSMPTFEWNNTY